MKILGLDVGSKRIGVAVSDELGITSRGLLVIERKSNEEIYRRLKDIISNDAIKEIVVGLPINMNGSHGPQAKAAEAFAGAIKKNFDIPVNLWDERMSTTEVERILIDAGLSRAKRKKKVDKLAAQVILQSYLNAKNVQNKKS